jgi:hypothetical protein
MKNAVIGTHGIGNKMSAHDHCNELKRQHLDVDFDFTFTAASFSPDP